MLLSRTRSAFRGVDGRRLMSSASAGVKVTFDKPFLTYKLEQGPPEETFVRRWPGAGAEALGALTERAGCCARATRRPSPPRSAARLLLNARRGAGSGERACHACVAAGSRVCR